MTCRVVYWNTNGMRVGLTLMTTILLVEDAHDLAQVIIRELEANSYRTLHASDGLTAL